MSTGNQCQSWGFEGLPEDIQQLLSATVSTLPHLVRFALTSKKIQGFLWSRKARPCLVLDAALRDRSLPHRSELGRKVLSVPHLSLIQGYNVAPGVPQAALTNSAPVLSSLSFELLYNDFIPLISKATNLVSLRIPALHSGMSFIAGLTRLTRLEVATPLPLEEAIYLVHHFTNLQHLSMMTARMWEMSRPVEKLKAETVAKMLRIGHLRWEDCPEILDLHNILDPELWRSKSQWIPTYLRSLRWDQFAKLMENGRVVEFFNIFLEFLTPEQVTSILSCHHTTGRHVMMSVATPEAAEFLAANVPIVDATRLLLRAVDNDHYSRANHSLVVRRVWVNALLKAGANPLERQPVQTALHACDFAGLLPELLEAAKLSPLSPDDPPPTVPHHPSVYLEITNQYGATPLNQAIRENNAEMVLALLVAGADPLTRKDTRTTYQLASIQVFTNSATHSALMAGKLTQSETVFRTLLQFTPKSPAIAEILNLPLPLLTATQSTAFRPILSALLICLVVLLLSGSDLNGGDTILHIFARTRRTTEFDLVHDFAKEASATLNFEAKNSSGVTPVYVALLTGNEDLVIKLLDLGVNYDITSQSGVKFVDQVVALARKKVLAKLQQMGLTIALPAQEPEDDSPFSSMSLE